MKVPTNLLNRLLILSFFLIFVTACSSSNVPININADSSNTSNVKDVVLYKKGDMGYHSFRIPALCVTGDGTILAFAEGRKDSSADAGHIDLFVRRSTDDGKTWSKAEVIASDGRNINGNPLPFVDRDSGDVIVFYIWGQAEDTESNILKKTSKSGRRVYQMRSSDNGKTWGEAEDITSMVKLDEFTWYATGPGGAIQIEGGKYDGRIVCPMNTATANPTSYWAGSLYSDDGAKTWHLSKLIDFEGANESQIVQIDKDTLAINMRVQSRNPDGTRKAMHRLIALSKDGGATWGEPFEDTGLPEPICQGSIISYKNLESEIFQKGERTIIFSNPADYNQRKNVTIKYTDSKTYTDWINNGHPETYNNSHWLSSEVICFDKSGYTDLAYNGKKLFIIYEHGSFDIKEILFTSLF